MDNSEVIYKFGTKKPLTRPKNTREAVSLCDLLNQPAHLFPEKICYRYRRNKGDCSISFREMKELTDAISLGLGEILQKGSHIALIGDKSVEWIASYIAIVGAQCVVVPLDRELDREQIPGFIEFADCSAVMYSSKYSDIFENPDKPLSGISHFFNMDCVLPANALTSAPVEEPALYMTLGGLAAFGKREYIKNGVTLTREKDMGELCAIIFTSGTTGSSKGVMLSEQNITFCINQAIRFVDITENDVLLSILPLHHTYEMTAGILAAMFCGATVCLGESLTTIMTDFRRYRPTMTAMVPLIVSTMYKKITDTAKKQGKDKKLTVAKKVSGGLKRLGIDVSSRLFSDIRTVFGSRLRQILCGGAALDPELVEAFSAFGISLKQGYGITECAPIISVVPYDVTNPASCGMLLPGMQVYIDKENPGDETGEICVKGDNVMLGYYKNPEATAAVLTSRGWFCTGDCGYADENRFLYITGRSKNVIVLPNGKNVFPEEIEEYLGRVEIVKECMVTSYEDGERVKLTAIVFPDYDALAVEGITEPEAVRAVFRDKVAEVNRRLASYKQIRNIEIRRDPFPKTSTQKIQRFKVGQSGKM